MRHIKFISTLLIIIMLNIMLFSPALLAVDMFSVIVLEQAFAWTVVVISSVWVLIHSYRYVFGSTASTTEKSPHVDQSNVNGTLTSYRQHRLFGKEVELAVDQERRLALKKDLLISLLNERFQHTELTYNRFYQVIVSVEVLFKSNMNGLIHKLRGSELSDLHPRYNMLFTNKVLQQKQQLLQDYMGYVEGYLNMNEQILMKLDQLLLEVTLLQSIALKDIDQLPCIQEITRLIQQTKHYKE